MTPKHSIVVALSAFVLIAASAQPDPLVKTEEDVDTMVLPLEEVAGERLGQEDAPVEVNNEYKDTAAENQANDDVQENEPEDQPNIAIQLVSKTSSIVARAIRISTTVAGLLATTAMGAMIGVITLKSMAKSKPFMDLQITGYIPNWNDKQRSFHENNYKNTKKLIKDAGITLEKTKATVASKLFEANSADVPAILKMTAEVAPEATITIDKTSHTLAEIATNSADASYKPFVDRLVAKLSTMLETAVEGAALISYKFQKLNRGLRRASVSQVLYQTGLGMQDPLVVQLASHPGLMAYMAHYGGQLLKSKL